ncbi:UPF0669 protein v1g209471-like [Macrosteles quadrilineatus]|uniref:UPF0669 protein v1g209471-like n=1 Tax=Macrosteles quadrilineatus TaxID=74068 RepID=UPI0023E15D6E|nr:UPF0669 protein v1g209471-like [Macrosteles quadrilineatus]
MKRLRDSTRIFHSEHAIHKVLSIEQLNAHVLHSVSGEVVGGNYTYYSLMYKGPITLYLYSSFGDADLYVSQFVNKPSFEPDNYCLQSSTCGLDVVHIPKSFKRPVGIAVYGHPSYEVSEYYLEVVYRQNKDIYVFEEDEEDQEGYFGQEQKIDREEGDQITEEGEQKEEEEAGSFLTALLWTFLNILVEVLFL